MKASDGTFVIGLFYRNFRKHRKKKMIEWQLLWQNYKVNNIIYVHKKCELYKMIKLVTLIKHK